MINTDFKQGTFKKGDDLVLIDSCGGNYWAIVSLLENYGPNRDIETTFLYKSGKEFARVINMDTQFVDTFYNVYKIVKEYKNDWWTIYITIFKKR